MYDDHSTDDVVSGASLEGEAGGVYKPIWPVDAQKKSFKLLPPDVIFYSYKLQCAKFAGTLPRSQLDFRGHTLYRLLVTGRRERRERKKEKKERRMLVKVMREKKEKKRREREGR